MKRFVVYGVTAAVLWAGSEHARHGERPDWETHSAEAEEFASNILYQDVVSARTSRGPLALTWG